MRDAQKYALDAAKEITIAAFHNYSETVDELCGKDTVNFFETVYSAILKLAQEGPDKH